MACSSKRDIFQFKVSLTPDIWRRIQVPANYTFQQLHWAIQDSMGWKKNKKAHFGFIAEEKMRENPLPRSKASICFVETGETVVFPEIPVHGTVQINLKEHIKLKDHFRRNWRKNLKYECGFQCCRHEVVLEEMLPASGGSAYPKCVAGKSACQPKNCEDYVKHKERLNIRNPRHQEFQKMKSDTVIPSPEEFDPNSVVFMEGKM